MITLHSASVGMGTGQDVEPHVITISSNSASRSVERISRNGKPSNSGDASIGDCTAYLHPSVQSAKAKVTAGTCEGDSRIGLARRILSALARLEDHWIGDLIGVVSLFAIGWSWMLLGYAWGLE